MPTPPVGKNMEACRRDLGITAAALAREIGVQPITFYRWREGTVTPKWENVVAASEVVHKTPDWFYGEHDDDV